MSRDREVARRLAALVPDFLSGALAAGALVKRLRSLADWIEAGAAPPKAKPKNDPRVTEIFDYWRSCTSRPRAKLTAERRTKIAARLSDGYSPEDCKAAIRFVASDPFHQGENEQGRRYDDITLALRNGSKLETYRDQAASSGAAGPSAAELELEALNGSR